MATKVLFDNNFFDLFHGADEPTRGAIYKCVDQGTLEGFVSFETLYEVMGLALSKRKDMIVPFASYILRLTRGRILNPLEDAQESELRGAFQRDLEQAGRDQLVAFLTQAAGGHIPTAATTLGQDAVDYKNQKADGINAWVAAIVASTNAMTRAEKAAATFESIRKRHWNNTAERSVHSACKKFGIPDSDAVAARVMADPGAYGHFDAQMRMYCLVTHAYFIDDNSQHLGDLYDLRQLSYMVDMNVFVTNDKRLRRWGSVAFGTPREYVTPAEFMARSWC